MGGPPQSAAFARTRHPGVSRWTATWNDTGLDNDGQAIGVDTFIVAAAGFGTLELTFAPARTRDGGDSEMDSALSSLQVLTGPSCDRPS